MSVRDSAKSTALDGLRVIDFTQMLAGPYCTQELADLGADVIKIEVPVRGDDSRHYMTTTRGGEGAFYLSTNRNKRSVTLDLKCAAGRTVARKLIAGADIVVENFSNGVMERLGLDYASVSADNPRLIYCSISSYGRDEPAAVARRGYDAMFQAASGLMSLTGERGGMPMRTTVPIIDTATAMTATSAILAAVIARYRLDRGQRIEIALIDVAMAVLTLYGTAALITGESLGPNGNRAPQTAPSDAFQTTTGPIFLTCGNNVLFRRLCIEGFGRPDLADDPEFQSNRDRVGSIERLTAILQEIFAAHDRDYWLERLSGIGVPVAPIATIPEAMVSPDVVARKIISELPHPTAGTVPNVRSPYHFSMTPVIDPVAPPLLGQHNEEVLGQVMGMSSREIEGLREGGALGPVALSK